MATIQNDGTSVETYYVHTDHLSGTMLTTSSTTATVQTIDYVPYGNVRFNQQTGSFNEQRKYAGTEFDPASDLNFMMARYQDGGRGQFVSQDPAHLMIEDPRFEQRFGRNIQTHLADPQQLNSYGYARNNPLIYKDEKGEIPALLVPIAGGALIGAGGGFLGQYLDDVGANISEGRSGIGRFAPRSSGGEYVYSIGAGAAAGAATVGAGVLAGAVISFTGSATKDKIFENRVDYGNAAIESLTATVVPLAVNKTLGKVVGKKVSTFSKSLIKGAHSQRDASAEILIASLAKTLQSLNIEIQKLILNKSL